MSCPKCIEGYLLPGDLGGRIEPEFQGAYHAAGPLTSNSGNGTSTSTNTDGTQPVSKRAIVFLTDGFGLPLKNCKIMADELARRLGCDVWVPDYFDGRPIVHLDDMSTPDQASQKMTVLDWINFILFSGIPSLPAFIHSRPAVVDKRVTSFINLLKSKKGYEKIGIVGYCYGGATAIRFAGTDLVDAAVICHPGSFPVREASAIRVPTSWACAEVDIFWPKRLEVEAILASKKDSDGGAKLEYEFRDYKGTAHGFAARPNLNLPEIKEAHGQAFEQTVEWFEKTLLV